MKQIDPNIPAELLDMTPPEELCEDMALFTNLYFSENSLQNRDWKEKRIVITATSSAVM